MADRRARAVGQFVVGFLIATAVELFLFNVPLPRALALGAAIGVGVGLGWYLTADGDADE
ncbi:hypothetical protein DMJ13_14965 [halophilic archaeon]|nr:hypothetical protein DMJ13_14965 [halophilic archaeon]